MLKISINLNSLPKLGASTIRTGSSIRHIPPTAGLHRGTASPAVRYAGHHIPSTIKSRVSSQPVQLVVEKDKALDEEFQNIPELNIIFQDCLKSFPELSNIEIRATSSNTLSGAKGKLNNQPVVILFVPDQVWGKWNVLRPIILHELCHYLPGDVEENFKQRADSKSLELWNKMKDAGAIRCESNENVS